MLFRMKDLLTLVQLFALTHGCGLGADAKSRPNTPSAARGEWLHPVHVTSGIDLNPYIKLGTLPGAKKALEAASGAQPQRRFLHPTIRQR